MVLITLFILMFLSDSFKDLFACKETQLSPFNRQIFVSLDKEELEKKFS